MATPAVTRDTPVRGESAGILFARYHDQIHRFCLARLRSPQEAEDAVQTVFLRAHQALDRGVEPLNDEAWLYTIARNICISRHQASVRRARVETPSALDREDAAYGAPDARHEDLAGLREALDDMPPRLRRAILMREWQGLGYAEIADAMDTTVSAVDTLVFRARRHLATALRGGRRLLDLAWLRWLVPRLRMLLSGSAPAKVAAGAALLAAGGTAAVVGTAHVAPVGAAALPRTAVAGPAPAVSSPSPSVRPAAKIRPRAVPRAGIGAPAAMPTRGPARFAAAPYRRAAAPVVADSSPGAAAAPPATSTSGTVAPAGITTSAAAVTTSATTTVAAGTTTVAVGTTGTEATVTVDTPAVTTPVATVPTVDVTVTVPTVDVEQTATTVVQSLLP